MYKPCYYLQMRTIANTTSYTQNRGFISGAFMWKTPFFMGLSVVCARVCRQYALTT